MLRQPSKPLQRTRRKRCAAEGRRWAAMEPAMLAGLLTQPIPLGAGLAVRQRRLDVQGQGPDAFAFVLDDRPPRRNDILRGLSDTQFAAAHRADTERTFGSRSGSRVRAWPLSAMAVDLHGTACSEPA